MIMAMIENILIALETNIKLTMINIYILTTPLPLQEVKKCRFKTTHNS